MKIYATNISYTAKLPKGKKVKEVAEELPDFFRDRELFNPEKDKVTAGYYRYGTDDYPVHVNQYDPLYHDIRWDNLSKLDEMV